MTINQYLQKDLVLWIDTETSGVYASCDVCQISGLFEKDGEIIHTFNLYSHPFHDTMITPQALEAMGVSEKTLWTYPAPRKTYNELVDILQQYVSTNHIIVGHSIRFDVDKLMQFGKKVFYHALLHHSVNGFTPLDEYLHFESTFCTYRFAKQLRRKRKLPRTVGSNSLRNLSRELELENYRPHNALEDVRMVRKVCYKLLERRV